MNMKKFLRVLAITIFVSMGSFLLTGALAASLDYSDLMLEINWSDIAKVGHQISGSKACSCYAMAYCRTILDGNAHSFDEYNLLGTGEYDVNASWDAASYKIYNSSSKGEIFETIYNELSNGEPVCVYVEGRGSYEHYVTVIGYEKIEDLDDLSERNFLIIDPYSELSRSEAEVFEAENLGDVGYRLLLRGGVYKILVDTSSRSADFDASFIDCDITHTLATVEVSVDDSYLKSLPYKASTNSDSVSLYNNEPLPKGMKFTIDAIVFNSVGNMWYRTTWEGQKGYLYSGNVTVLDVLYDASISNASYPTGTLNQGSMYPVAGTITTSHNLEKIYVAVYDKQGNAILEKAETIHLRQRYSISGDIDNAMTFNTLPGGEYTFVIQITEMIDDPSEGICYDRTVELVSQAFSIA